MTFGRGFPEFGRRPYARREASPVWPLAVALCIACSADWTLPSENSMDSMNEIDLGRGTDGTRGEGRTTDLKDAVDGKPVDTRPDAPEADEFSPELDGSCTPNCIGKLCGDDDGCDGKCVGAETACPPPLDALCHTATCQADGTCLEQPKCPEGDQCKAIDCDSSGDCVVRYSFETLACDDDDPCTYTDLCTRGECHGVPVLPLNCDDRNPCTVDLCLGEDNGQGQYCEHVPTDELGIQAYPCDDGNPCTSDSCLGGVCISQALPMGEFTGPLEACSCMQPSDCDGLVDTSECTESWVCKEHESLPFNWCKNHVFDCQSFDDTAIKYGYCDPEEGCTLETPGEGERCDPQNPYSVMTPLDAEAGDEALACQCVSFCPEGAECGGDGCGGTCQECAKDDQLTCIEAVKCTDYACFNVIKGEACLVDGQCYDSYAAKPLSDAGDTVADPCHVCVPMLSQTDWTPVPEGTPCGQDGQGMICVEGACVCIEICAGDCCSFGGVCCAGNCCQFGEICSDGGCCQPDCVGKACGSDDCGGVCGDNDGLCKGVNAVCTEGICSCQPSCDGKECGDNGCGGSCSTCPEETECQDGQCVNSGEE